MRAQASRTSGLTLAGAWLLLVMLTVGSLGAGQWYHGASWLPLAIAALVWVKGTLIARYFIEANHAHPFIQWVLRAFIAFVPIWLLLSAWLGERLARWTTL